MTPRLGIALVLLVCGCGPAAIGTALGLGADDDSADGPAPLEITVDAGPPRSTNATTATFVFSSNRAATKFEGRFDGTFRGTVESPHMITDIARGAHEFVLTATTPDGQTRTTRYQWVKDPDPPVTTFATRPDPFSPSPSATFELRAEQGSTFRVQLDGGAFTALAGTTVTFDGLAEGEHRIEVEATDPAST